MENLDDIKDILVAFWYNRSNDDMKKLCEEIKNRLVKQSCRHTNDGDVLFSFIIIRYGDYGTSPRSGWLTDTQPKCIEDIITNFESVYLVEEAYF